MHMRTREDLRCSTIYNYAKCDVIVAQVTVVASFKNDNDAFVTSSLYLRLRDR